jgi:hypothetical protein
MRPQIIPLFWILVAQHLPRLGSPRGWSITPRARKSPCRRATPPLLAGRSPANKISALYPRCLPPTSAPQCGAVSYPAPRSAPSREAPLWRWVNHSTARLSLWCRGGRTPARKFLMPTSSHAPPSHHAAASRKIRRRNRLKSLGETLAREGPGKQWGNGERGWEMVLGLCRAELSRTAWSDAFQRESNGHKSSAWFAR